MGARIYPLAFILSFSNIGKSLKELLILVETALLLTVATSKTELKDPLPEIQKVIEAPKPIEWEDQPYIKKLPERRKARQKPPKAKPVVYTPPPSPAPQIAPKPPEPVASLTGSFGYALPYGNCVWEPGVNNPGWGNPADWPILSQTPTIGATALFWWNHTGVVTGIWSNGDVEIRHQNYYGNQSRFPRGMLRGFR